MHMSQSHRHVVERALLRRLPNCEGAVGKPRNDDISYHWRLSSFLTWWTSAAFATNAKQDTAQRIPLVSAHVHTALRSIFATPRLTSCQLLLSIFRSSFLPLLFFPSTTTLRNHSSSSHSKTNHPNRTRTTHQTSQLSPTNKTSPKPLCNNQHKDAQDNAHLSHCLLSRTLVDRRSPRSPVRTWRWILRQSLLLFSSCK